MWVRKRSYTRFRDMIMETEMESLIYIFMRSKEFHKVQICIEIYVRIFNIENVFRVIRYFRLSKMFKYTVG